ncbi:hypothetical protein OF83DRAFT_257887 [Amylostereum chailletii]|nr:hypothetical protein OF83DRAFT_257887 [Amylostereum chailletii]
MRCPQLWTYIPLNKGLAWTEAALERSQRSPISIYVAAHMEDQPAHRALRTVLHAPHVSRIAHCHVSVSWPGETEAHTLLFDFLNGPHVKDLESFTLFAPFDQFILPRGTLSGAPLPRLRYFELTHCFVPDWDLLLSSEAPQLRHLLIGSFTRFPPRMSPLLRAPQLTHLYVFNCEVWTTTDQVREALTHLPLLEEFSLSGTSLSISPSTESTPSTFVSLPHLKGLHLVTGANVLATLLSQIKIPLNTQIVLYLDTGVPHPALDHWTILHPPLEAHFSPALNAGLRYETVSVEATDPFYFRTSFILLATRSSLQEERSSSPSLLPGDLKIQGSVANSEMDTSTSQVLPLVRALFAIPMVYTGLRTLRVSYDFLFDELRSWHEVFGAVASVTKLEVCGRCATRFMAACADPERAMLFPYLRHLSIEAGRDAFLIPEGTPVSFAGNLKTWAEQRKAAGSALRRITLAECEIQAPEVDELRKAVGNSGVVEWDGWGEWPNGEVTTSL